MMMKNIQKWLNKMGIMMAVCFMVSLPAHAVPTVLGGGCSVGDPTAGPMTWPDSSDQFPAPVVGFNSNTLAAGSAIIAPDGSLLRGCFLPSQPVTAPDSLCDVTATESSPATPQYIALVDTTNLTYCLYQYDIDTTLADVRFNGAIATLLAAAPAAAIPVSGPFALFVMMLGLLWMGLRRRTV